MTMLIANTAGQIDNLKHLVALYERLEGSGDRVKMLEGIMRDGGYGSEENEILGVNTFGIHACYGSEGGAQMIINFKYIDDDSEESDGNFFVRFDAAGKLVGEF
jgi:hypothetical protein